MFATQVHTILLMYLYQSRGAHVEIKQRPPPRAKIRVIFSPDQNNRSPKHPALFVTANISGELGLWNLNNSMEEPFTPPVKVCICCWPDGMKWFPTNTPVILFYWYSFIPRVAPDFSRSKTRCCCVERKLFSPQVSLALTALTPACRLSISCHLSTRLWIDVH